MYAALPLARAQHVYIAIPNLRHSPVEAELHHPPANLLSCPTKFPQSVR